MAQLLPTLKQKFFNADGEPLVGGKIYTYAAGTSTPLATYTDQSGATPNANPIILDSSGECDIWIGDSAYKFVIDDADDNNIDTIDDVSYLNNNSIVGAKLVDGSVSKSKLNDDVAGNGITRDVGGALQVNVDNSTLEISSDIVRIKDLGVSTAKLANEAVTTAKIAEKNVTAAKIADETISLLNLSKQVKSFIKRAAYLNWKFMSYESSPVTLNESTDTVSGLTQPVGACIKFLMINRVTQDDGQSANPTGVSVNFPYFVIGSGQISESVGGSAEPIDTASSSALAVSVVPPVIWQSIAFGNGVFVALSSFGSMVMKSIDAGASWICVVPPELNAVQDISFGNNYFVIICRNGTNRVFRSADDGVNWTAVAAAEANTWTGLANGNGVFVAVSEDGTNRVMRSTNNGASWTAIAAAEANSWQSIAYGNETFVAVASDGTNRVMRSEDDGLTWSAVAAAEANTWTSIVFGDGVFVAISTNGTNRVMRSIDNGATWNAVAISTSVTWKDLTFGNGIFVAAGTGLTGLIASYDLGATWEPIPWPPNPTQYSFLGSETFNTPDSVAFGQGRFIALYSGYVARSEACEVG